MILVRRHSLAVVEEIDLDEFERRAKSGDLSPQHEVCFPAVTGTAFVPAQSLELYRGLSAQGLLTFRRYFHLARMPYVTLALIAVLVAAYFGWQGGRPVSIEQLVQQGAKSPPVMRELGQWWRLITANGLHISGWHLAANAVFLFNLGGPAEAVFRRLDYLIIVAASGIAAMLLSTLASPLVSCGASGIVFGVWGAAAVFGMRYRELLPDRYRRYFIGSVIPYSLFTLYLGFAIPGVDNWSHLGGLAAGSALAMVLPPRLMAPRDSWVHAKLFALAAAALLMAALTLDPPGVGPLSQNRYYAATGLVVPVPRRWDLIAQERTRNHESYAFANGAGVAVALQGRLETQPVDLRELGKRFVERDLAAQLEAAQSRGHRIHEPVPVTVAGLAGERVDAEIAAHGFVAAATYVVLARGYYHYVVSFTAPDNLAGHYQETFAAVMAGITLAEPDLVATARRRLREDTPARHSELALALAQAGLWQEAEQILAGAAARWPQSPEIARTTLRLRQDRGLTEPEGGP